MGVTAEQLPAVYGDLAHRPHTGLHCNFGFQLVRADQSMRESGKRRGGGLAMYVNERWTQDTGHIMVKEQRCTKDIELLAVSIRPYHLAR